MIIHLNATVDEEQLWELLVAVQQVQEMAHSVWS